MNCYTCYLLDLTECLDIKNCKKMKIETEEYEKALDKYLIEGINYNANTIKKADPEDLQQLASDSFFYGCLFVMEMFGIKELKPPTK